jgi:16S rRNA A1518/A1519 N6-dimethyltransferase RsmA/KsgA/DIM1 with predicted DNA glycosylase/AP lyase activity
MEQCAIDPQRRAETLGMDDFINLSETLASFLDKPSVQE